MDNLLADLNEKLETQLVNTEKRLALTHINQALEYIENKTYSVIDRQYFEEMCEPITLEDLLICVATCLEAELQEEKL